jgi:LytR cell envelope-related transcriptional attenuator
MGRVNLGTSRIVIILALTAIGIAVLANGFASSGVVAGGTDGSTPSQSGSPSQSAGQSPGTSPSQTPAPNTDGVKIAVFNGTDETGLAAGTQMTLEDAGYVAAQEPTDAPSKGVKLTIVYYRGGPNAAQHESDATHLAQTYLGDAKVKRLSDTFAGLVPAATEIVIVLGQDAV